MRAVRVNAVPRYLFLFLALSICLLVTRAVAQTKKFDHQAHAVPGKDRRVKDFDGDGFAEVELNGELSHSHFFNPKNSSDNGRIVEYAWTENRLKSLISTEVKFKYLFPVGDTIVTLVVKDHMNDTAKDTVKVTVEPSGTQGAYYYYYDMAGLDVVPHMLSYIDKDEHRPKFGTPTKQINYVGGAWPILPSSIPKGPFIIQVLADFLAIRDETYTFYIAMSNGIASLHVNGKQVLWMNNEEDGVKTGKAYDIDLTQGKHELQLRFYTTDPTDPSCILGIEQKGDIDLIKEEMISYEAHSILPTIHQVSTTKSTLAAGGKMFINGAGFYGKVDVVFGDELAWNIKALSPHRLVLNIPSSDQVDDVLLAVKTRRGTSNGIPFSYDKEHPMPIKFKESFVTYENGTVFPSKQFSSVALGPDMRYYFGSLDSRVHVVTISHLTMTVSEYCQSVGTGYGRTVAGVAFDPADSEVRVYISTNMFYWRDYYSVPDAEGWHNGKIQTMVVGNNEDGDCLIHEKDVVTGLPVSNHDHGVNNLVFDNHGNLYIQVGGSTNAGVSKPDDLVGGVKESVFSAATVVAHLREPGFNGTIVYDSYDDPGLAKSLTPTKFVEGYAYGFRNSFGAVYHTSGNIFATDNGPNENYGNASTSCTTEGPDPWHPDSLVLVTKGAYFGYPNRARGLQIDEVQCVYYSAEDEVHKGFTPALATFEASTNGVIEYTANTFEGQMKGDLLISKYAVMGRGKLFRVQLDATKKAVKGSVEELRDFSGLSLVMNPFGAIVMPRVQQPNIAVLTPDEEEVPGNEPRMIAVSPNRGPRKGGNPVIITGKNLTPDTKIRLGNKPCKVFMTDVEDNSWVMCTVPTGSGSVTVSISTKNGFKKTKYPDYHYMLY